MDDLSVSCGCGRTMTIDARHGRGAYRCGCGNRVVIDIPRRRPSCVALTSDDGRCSVAPTQNSLKYGVSLCGDHVDAYISYLAVVEQAKQDKQADIRSYLAEATSERGRMTLEAEAKREAYKDQSVVYYVRIGDTIKIGSTINMKQRMSQLMPDQILATEPGDLELERMRQKQFLHCRIRGERFEPVPDLMSHVAMLRSHHGPPQVTGYLYAEGDATRPV